MVNTNKKRDKSNCVHVNKEQAFSMVNIVCKYFNVNKDDVRSGITKEGIIKCRHFIHYFLYSKTRLTETDIGLITNKNRQSVGYSYRTIDNLLIHKDYSYDRFALELIINKILPNTEKQI